MTSWIRKLGWSATALTLALVMGGCDHDGGGGGRLLTLFFGINGTGDCSSVEVTIDLDEANAVIDEDINGNLNCDPDNTLEALGCTFEFDIQDGTFTAVIDDCTIPAVTNLFSCKFREGTIQRIRAVTVATCMCEEGEECDEDPDICVDETPDPTDCEDCDNGRDDDGDGLVDCDDPACQNDPGCGEDCDNGIDDDGDGEIDCDDPACEDDPDCVLPSTSTSTTTTSSSTTTTSNSTTTSSTTTVTTTSTTTSTTIPFRLTCGVTFLLPSAVELGAIQWEVDYSAAPGIFVGSGAIPEQGGTLECANLVPDSQGSFNDVDSTSRLTIGIISVDGFTGPTELAECTMKTQVEPTPADFDIVVQDAADPDLNPIVPPPSVTIRIDQCRDIGTGSTSTTTSSTTTLDGDTTTTTTTTTMGPPPGTQNVIFRLADAVTLGALQFIVNYANANGDWVTIGPVLDCTSLVTGGLPAFADDQEEERLSVGIIALTGFTGPTDVASCRFDPFGAAPGASDFTITVVDASTPELMPVTPFPAVTVRVEALR